jgi:hypothetical protein
MSMTDAIGTHRLLSATMAFAALIGWGAELSCD